MQDACKLYMLKLYHAENGSPNIGRPTHKIFQVGSWVDSQRPVNCTCSNTIMHSGSLNIGRPTQNVSQVGSWNGTPEACELHKLKLYYALRKPVHREAHTKLTSNKISNLKDNCAVTWGCVCGKLFVTIRAMHSFQRARTRAPTATHTHTATPTHTHRHTHTLTRPHPHLDCLLMP